MPTASEPIKRTPRPGSIAIFLVVAFVAIAALQAAHRFFPGSRGIALMWRQFCMLVAVALLILVSRRLLRRDGHGEERLGLGFSRRHGVAFAVGALLAGAHMLLLLGAFHLAAPFQLTRGAQPAEDVALAGLGYLTGNFLEELIFRGYLLVAMAHWLGTTRALWLLAVPFGLFHFPGLDAMALAKMMLTTGAMHFVFAYVFLATRSLWAAVSLHAVGNTLLHEVLGLGRPAFLEIHYSRDFPTSFDLPFLLMLGVTATVALILSRLPATRRGADWLQGSN